MIPAEVKSARLALGYTQQQLADALGITGEYAADTVRSWESGRRPISGPASVAIRLMLDMQAKGKPRRCYRKHTHV
jgi:DNA-binding transcriptional regulator YiaG